MSAWSSQSQYFALSLPSASYQRHRESDFHKYPEVNQLRRLEYTAPASSSPRVPSHIEGDYVQYCSGGRPFLPSMVQMTGEISFARRSYLDPWLVLLRVYKPQPSQEPPGPYSFTPPIALKGVSGHLLPHQISVGSRSNLPKQLKDAEDERPLPPLSIKASYKLQQMVFKKVSVRRRKQLVEKRSTKV